MNFSCLLQMFVMLLQSTPLSVLSMLVNILNGNTLKKVRQIRTWGEPFS